MSDQLVASALAALDAKLSVDGLPTFHDSTMAVADALLRLHDRRCESMLCYWLDRNRRLLGVEEVAKGSEDAVTFSRAHVARRALAVDAYAVLMIHNHPSGDPTPSAQDIAAADRVDRQLAAIDVMVLAHFAVAHEGYGDIRTGKVIRFRDLREPGAQACADGPRCPHCHGPLERTDDNDIT